MNGPIINPAVLPDPLLSERKCMWCDKTTDLMKSLTDPMYIHCYDHLFVANEAIFAHIAQSEQAATNRK